MALRTPNDDDDGTSHPSPDFRAAVRRARVEEAERADVVSDLRGAELARLELLLDALEPVLAQFPADVDLFDVGLTQGLRPRLFIDMIAFVDMGHDKRHYRFVQDTRHGRVILATSDGVDATVEAIMDYMARRLVDREKALASAAMPPRPNEGPMPHNEGLSPQLDATPPLTAEPSSPRPRQRRPRRRWLSWLVGVVIDYLGLIALCVIVWFVIRAIGQHWQDWMPPPR
ncbi:hypothetical protein [Lichenihabitans psoromatis]|uniref:hypothetical protein n=1 Tax=Lichenihabitans psoromatis TaxID=2528642 RepID=UPI0010362612|nr:hypothetical protein [Lichenihabitans psoromatis]